MSDTNTGPVVGQKKSKRNIRVPVENNKAQIVPVTKVTDIRGTIQYDNPTYQAKNQMANILPSSARYQQIQQDLYNAGFYDSNDTLNIGKRSPADAAALQRAMVEANANGEKWEDVVRFRIAMGAANLTQANAAALSGSGSRSGKSAKVAGSLNITGPQSARESLNALYLKYTGAKPTDSDFADAYAKLVDAQTKAPVQYAVQKIKGKYYNVQISDSVNADQFLEQYVFNKINFGSDQIGGAVGDTLSSIDEIANDYNAALTVQERGQFAKGLIDGSMTAIDVKKNLAERAKTRYKGLANNINENVSVKALASDYISTMADVLEMDADTIKLGDVEKAISGDTPMSLSDWSMELKKDNRYQFTNRARGEAASLASSAAAAFGYGQV